ncbi:hypothetical protein I3842_01G144100 [Carya illinoinensis]|uniref:Uncharacterized protein n=1 Tax=Carya illinoinensis TaxID=32201 RepID=A0A922G0B9_CARIL|nr:hypothetical protein I3842_01G144100 [Carya illinoinensis]
MASQPQADKLFMVGLEGFAIIDKVYGARPRRYGYWLPPPPPPTHAYHHHGKNNIYHDQEIMSEVPAQMKEAHYVTKSNMQSTINNTIMQSGNNSIRGQNSPVMIIYSEVKYF